MSKRKDYNIQLLTLGVLIPELHYGLHAREWWIPITGTDLVDTGFFPLRVRQKIAVELNGRQFITQIIQENNIPNYCYELHEVLGSVENSATNAVSKLYQDIFHVNSKFSGSLMLGHNKQSIMQELLWDIPFHPFKIDYDKCQIWIYSLGTSENSDLPGAGPGYSSSFLYFYTKNKKKQRVLIWQTIDENGCHIEIYCDNELLGKFHNKTPSTVWKNADFLANTDGIGLFGLRNNITQDQLNKMPINWYSVFINWLDQSTIMELYSILEKIYPCNYKFSKREIRAWHAMFKATGCSPITLFSHNESQYEFWTRSENSNIDKNNLQFLYKQGFLRFILDHVFNATETFWNCFAQALAENPCGSNGQRPKIYSNINGHGSLSSSKPKIKRQILPKKLEEELETLKIIWNEKNSLYDSIEKRTIPISQNLGGLCAICNQYGYKVFKDLKNLIIQELNNSEKQEFWTKKLEGIQRYLKHDYQNHIKVDIAGNVEHDTSSHSKIESNREKKDHRFGTLSGVSNWGEWQWPNNGPYTSHIRARALPNFGTWKNFTPAQIAKVTKIILIQPAPQISEHSILKSS
ncbi:hypothetical protein C2G38_2179132 [Gigaspora rosea]|uniref:Uncharacterized protein n=1 Tax=Gigaspora rosea TaxID=44941 RepID=A0A397VF88_9GLOM|nr:hypothetical protein C2G38_2179132 [Gigaspora rosea]